MYTIPAFTKIYRKLDGQLRHGDTTIDGQLMQLVAGRGGRFVGGIEGRKKQGKATDHVARVDIEYHCYAIAHPGKSLLDE